MSFRTLQYIIGLFVLIALSYQIWSRLEALSIESITLHPWATLLLAVVCVMAAANWIIEAYKWYSIFDDEGLSFMNAIKTVLVGLTFAIFTPGRIGDYAGRAIHSSSAMRSKSLPATFFCSLAQLVVTGIAGLMGLLYYINQIEPLNHSVAWISAIISLAMVLYFTSNKITVFISSHIKIPAFIRAVAHLTTFGDKFRLLGLSGIRYLIYSTQLLILLWAFNIEIATTDAILGICILFLVQTIIPMPMLFQVATKIELGLLIWASYEINPVALAAAMFTLWIVNVVIPALVGYKLLTLKIEERRSL